MAIKDDEVVTEPAVAAEPVVVAGALLPVSEYEDWEHEIAIGFDKIMCIGMRRKLCELQEKCRAKR